MMLQLREAGKHVFAPARIIFERPEPDAYKLEENTLTVPHAQAEGQIVGILPRLFEQRECDVCACEESALRTTPLLLDQITTVAVAPLLESVVAESIGRMPVVEPEISPLSEKMAQVQFRQALLEVDDPAAFWDGVVGGQIAMVETQQPLTGALVFELFEDAVRDLECSETWLVGYFLGLSDALLRHRKVYPHAYSALLKPLKMEKKR